MSATMDVASLAICYHQPTLGHPGYCSSMIPPPSAFESSPVDDGVDESASSTTPPPIPSPQTTKLVFDCCIFIYIAPLQRQPL
jgi:hypothetical protein